MQAGSYVIAGIGTGIGKTLMSTIVAEALTADYYKPIQCGSLHQSDSKFVELHINNSKTVVHREQFRLKTPSSPHEAARREGVCIKMKELGLPQTKNRIVIEPAGGLMVPLNEDELFIDWIEHIELPVILVSDIYLGSINHTLLSIEAIQRRNLKIKGLIFNHHPKKATEEVIAHYSQLPILLQVRSHPQITKKIIRQYASELLRNCKSLNVEL